MYVKEKNSYTETIVAKYLFNFLIDWDDFVFFNYDALWERNYASINSIHDGVVYIYY